MEEFFEKTQQYVKYVHLDRWQDEQFRMCTDTFHVGIILSMVDFVENYSFQPPNKIHSQYYHSDQVSIMVHITYRHGEDSTKEKRVILKEYHFCISDDKCHDLVLYNTTFNCSTIT